MLLLDKLLVATKRIRPCVMTVANDSCFFAVGARLAQKEISGFGGFMVVDVSAGFRYCWSSSLVLVRGAVLRGRPGYFATATLG
jgi:hypothetical protein